MNLRYHERSNKIESTKYLLQYRLKRQNPVESMNESAVILSPFPQILNSHMPFPDRFYQSTLTNNEYTMIKHTLKVHKL